MLSFAKKYGAIAVADIRESDFTPLRAATEPAAARAGSETCPGAASRECGTKNMRWYGGHHAYAEASSSEPTAVELAEFDADAVSVLEVEEAGDAGLVCEPKPKSPRIVPRSARTFCRSVPKLEPTVDAPELSAPVADAVAELPPPAEISICEPAVGAGLGGPPGGPPWLPSTPCPATCCWKSLKSVCTSLNKVWKSLPSDEGLDLDDEPLVAGESVPLFDALVEFASPFEPGELISRISSWNVSSLLAGEPLLEPVAAVLVGVVPVLLLIEPVLLLIENVNCNSAAELLMLPMLMLRTNRSQGPNLRPAKLC